MTPGLDGGGKGSGPGWVSGRYLLGYRCALRPIASPGTGTISLKTGTFGPGGRAAAEGEKGGESAGGRDRRRKGAETMATYAIGDVQGCANALHSLLDHIGFERDGDRLWFAGDLVNRGPDSLEVLRFVSELGERAVTVLGNHDLHLLATAAGARRLRAKDTFAEVLRAPDRPALLDWLRTRPLLHHDAALGFTMVHAGLPPQWALEEAGGLAREVEETLRGAGSDALLHEMYADEPRRWSPALAGPERLRFVINALTRLRYVAPDGGFDFKHQGPPGTQAPGLLPWFEAPERRSRGVRIVFGHWATLELHGPVDPGHGVYPVDTGCVWGGALSALRLEDGRRFSVPGLRTGAGR